MNICKVENNRTNLLVILAGYEDKMVTNKVSLPAQNEPDICLSPPPLSCC